MDTPLLVRPNTVGSHTVEIRDLGRVAIINEATYAILENGQVRRFNFDLIQERFSARRPAHKQALALLLDQLEAGEAWVLGVTGRNSTYTAAYRVRPESHFLKVEESLPVRKLTKREDEALERGGSLEQGASNWSEEEIESSVRAYIEMKRKDDAGEPYTKTSYYRALSEQFPARSPKSFEYRMQNISYVYSLLGRRWLEGHKPKRNVGTNVAALIEEKIAEIEGSDIPPTAAFELEVEQARRRKMASPPEGSQTPQKTQNSTTQYIRSAEVVAWVLEAADGVCEACDQSAPFSKPDGTGYLEVHHLRRLADGGSDTIANAIAACPNCHRELHYGVSRDQLLSAVYAKVSRLVEE